MRKFWYICFKRNPLYCFKATEFIWCVYSLIVYMTNGAPLTFYIAPLLDATQSLREIMKLCHKFVVLQLSKGWFIKKPLNYCFEQLWLTSEWVNGELEWLQILCNHPLLHPPPTTTTVHWHNFSRLITRCIKKNNTQAL